MDIRNAAVSRVTGETQIEIKICLDGTGKCEAATGIGFFDHMLNSFARHGLFDLSVNVQGDLDVDSHHTIEDTGTVSYTHLRPWKGLAASAGRYSGCRGNRAYGFKYGCHLQREHLWLRAKAE